MADFALLFPSKYLGAADLMGKDQTVKIAGIKLEGIEGQDDSGKPQVKQKALVTLEGVAKPWLMNRTNAESIALMFGRDTKDWRDKAITLHGTMVDSFGEKVLAVRVKGSPLLKAPISKTVKRGRKKLQISLVPTQANPGKPQPAPTPPPPEPVASEQVSDFSQDVEPGASGKDRAIVK